MDESIKKWERQQESPYMFEPITMRETESSQEKPPDLVIETPSATDITDEEEQLLSPQESYEHFKKIDWWGDVMKEIDEEIGDSGDTSALDESETESGTERFEVCNLNYRINILFKRFFNYYLTTF